VTQVRARRSPGAIAAMWGGQAVLGLVVALPAACVVSRAFGADPRGDATLWDAGGHPLLVLLSRDSHAIGAELCLTSIALVFAAVIGLLPMAALMVAMVSRTSGRCTVAYAAARSVRAFPALAVLLGVALLAQGATVGAAWVSAKVVDLCVREASSEAGADLIEAMVLLPFAPLLGALAVVHDLARAAAVRFRMGAFGAASLAFHALRRSAWSTAWGYTWRQVASLSAVLAGAVAAGALGGRRGGALVILTVVHQTVIGSRVALRASWLAQALRAVADGSRRDHAGLEPR